MKTAIVIALFAIFATVGDKIDKQTEDIKDLSVAIGRIEEKLSE